LISDVENQRSRADSGVEAPVDVAEERIPTNCCVPDASRKVFKGVRPFRRGEVWIASIRWWTDGFYDRRKPHRGQRQEDYCEYGISVFHNLVFPFLFGFFGRGIAFTEGSKENEDCHSSWIHISVVSLVSFC